MRCISYFVDKETKEELSYDEVCERYEKNFATYSEFLDWRDEHFETKEKWIESPYERTRNYVYSTGNKWVIENFNATH